jgi:hypothetical protein
LLTGTRSVRHPRERGDPAKTKKLGSRFRGNGDIGAMKFQLVPHPAFPPLSITAVEVELTATDWEDVLIDFSVSGETALALPAWTTPGRAEGLWTTTCFELFLKKPDCEAYLEFNFSPSSQWAAYAFDSYRSGMRELVLSVDPIVEFDPDLPHQLSVDLDLSDTPNVPLLASISAVIEEEGGAKSYWALAHPRADRPDFHHPDCFVLEVPSAGSP